MGRTAINKEMQVAIACRVPLEVKEQLMEECDKKEMSLSEIVAMRLMVGYKNKNLSDYYQDNLTRFINVLANGKQEKINELVDLWNKTKTK